MWWVVLWAVVTLIGAAGTVASLNNVRFSRRVAHEVREMVAASRVPPPVSHAALEKLPAPVRHYLANALPGQTSPIRHVRVQHGGTFRPSLTGNWLPIRGEQHFTTDPPGFIWRGRVRIAPGLWIDARDRSVQGAGSMLVELESTIALADSRGPELDQGALLRLLGEMAWFPTTFLDGRYVRWSAEDEQRARATLSVNGRAVSGEFTFGADHMPATFAAERYRDIGGGRSALTPFVGRTSDFRRVDGFLVPHRVVGAWIVDGREIEYADFRVERLAYD
jgi:hypothetical protein